ncbi:hypothetical protein GWI33_012971 [Rhynchophorus ferrugineus]|uniref:Ionotropic receptor n=1 Tax=Rhynchophorus ferrugineus TaxID=354439 RepID=A0A834I956_RHYFE|nr:hypothetical protein GWI33_012971 [Rhynchophorus ferrugineus]
MSLSTSSIIQGKLASTMTGISYVDTVRSIQDLVQSELPIRMFNVSRYAFRDINDTSTKQLLERFIPIPPLTELYNVSLECVEKMDFISITDRSFLLTHPYVHKTHGYLEFETMKVSYVMPLNHPVSEYFWIRIQRIIQVGVVDKIFGSYRNWYQLKEASRIPSDEKTFVLTVKLLKLPFLLCLFGNTLAVIAFGLELIYFRYIRPIKSFFN